VSLILGGGTLAILGTFLVRSGILDSIHAFGASTLGIPFVVLLVVMVGSSVGLVLWRRDRLRSQAQLDSLLSREAVFLLQNLVLVAMVLVIFWVTFFPLISEAVTGTKVSVGPPAFRPFIVPLAKGADGNTWSVASGAKLSDAQYQAYKAGNLYVNVHTAAHKGGEIRAQIKP